MRYSLPTEVYVSNIFEPEEKEEEYNKYPLVM
jgi:hypothetical protein